MADDIDPDGTFLMMVKEIRIKRPERAMGQLAITMLKRHHYETHEKYLNEYRDVVIT